MRASKRTIKVQNASCSVKKAGEIHISGAEGLYKLSELGKVARDYLLRAARHPRGEPDRIVLTIEKVDRKPFAVPLLNVAAVQCDTPEEARGIVGGLLSEAGISGKGIRTGMRVVTGRTAMRGAALVRAVSALRVEPDKKRGLRVSRLGIAEDAARRLSGLLSRRGINTPTVKEAIILASKVAFCRGVLAELCISDDPDYTTGYVASKVLGYVRVPHIKRKGSLSGGRVFFVEEGADVKKITEYMEKTPILVRP